jgi:hypothetical protein
MHNLLSRAGDMGNAAEVNEWEGVPGGFLFSMGSAWTVPSRVNGG